MNKINNYDSKNEFVVEDGWRVLLSCSSLISPCFCIVVARFLGKYSFCAYDVNISIQPNTLLAENLALYVLFSYEKINKFILGSLFIYNGLTGQETICNQSLLIIQKKKSCV